jgi:choline dehydrogenase-like flavoprotein
VNRSGRFDYIVVGAGSAGRVTAARRLRDHGARVLAVLPPELCVRGVDGLRMFDASTMPSIVSGSTHAPVMAIPHRADSPTMGESPLPVARIPEPHLEPT